MASRRQLKKDVDYLAGEVISNCLTCLYFKPDKNRDKILDIVDEAVSMRNELFERMPFAEKHNGRLVKKHYAALRLEMFDRVDGLFVKLSEACK